MRRELTYATVCSGVECMSAAAIGLPLRPVFFSEIEPFPCAVLKHRFPHVPNLGDMSRITVNEKGEITNGRTTVALPAGGLDILAGGTPCQDVSNAGRSARRCLPSGTKAASTTSRPCATSSGVSRRQSASASWGSPTDGRFPRLRPERSRMRSSTSSAASTTRSARSWRATRGRRRRSRRHPRGRARGWSASRTQRPVPTRRATRPVETDGRRTSRGGFSCASSRRRGSTRGISTKE